MTRAELTESITMPFSAFREALQKAADGESPDGIIEDWREQPEVGTGCTSTCEPDDCGFTGTGSCNA